MRGKRWLCAATFTATVLVSTTALANMPKYVFFFVGDGMSSSQIQATEAYLTTKNGGSATLATDLLKPENRLNMSKLPVLGMQTTYDSHALMTDSASAGTAFASGIKTRSGVIGMDDSKTVSYKSIAQLAAEKGKRVGIVTSVSLDHATPAAFYASVPSRGEMNTIGSQMADTGYDFFGGGGLAGAVGAVDVMKKLNDNGYTVLNSRDAILDLKKNPKSKVVAINPILDGSKAMPYAIDRNDVEGEETDLSLADMTEVAIASLLTRKKENKRGGWANKDDGFFLMVESGKLDWACHANDAMATIGDTLAFDDAVGVALDFYRAHPAQTLIVVTGDHETGGMTVGHATTGYKAYYEQLLGQKISYDAFYTKWEEHENNSGTFETMKALMAEYFGLNYDALNAYQKEKLADAYKQSRNRTEENPHVNGNTPDENKLLYGGYEPIIVTITHILNEQASIGWTSYSHTGVPVPVFAIGREAKRFAGFYDNTDIAKQMARAMGIWQPLPVVKEVNKVVAK